MEDERLLFINNVLRCSNSPECKFTYTEEVRQTLETKTFYSTSERRAKLFAEGEIGTISDAYILWILCCMHYATADTIERLLQAYSRANKNLLIATGRAAQSSQATSAVESRVYALARQYALCLYKQYTPNNHNKHVDIYGPMPDSVSYVNNILSKRVPTYSALETINANETLAKAAASYVCSMIAYKSPLNLVAIREKMMKSGELGNFFLPPTIRLEGRENEFSITCFPAYFHKVNSYQTAEDFNEYVKRICDTIINAIYIFEKSEKSAGNRKIYAVIVCDGENDMIKFAQVAENYRRLTDFGNENRILLTSEGAIRTIIDIKKAFLKMRRNEEGKIIIEPATPDFL